MLEKTNDKHNELTTSGQPWKLTREEFSSGPAVPGLVSMCTYVEIRENPFFRVTKKRKRININVHSGLTDTESGGFPSMIIMTTCSGK